VQLEPAEARAAVTALLGVEQKASRGSGGGSLSVSPLAAAAVRRRFGFSFCFILFCSVLFWLLVLCIRSGLECGCAKCCRVCCTVLLCFCVVCVAAVECDVL
jgi:hypothetical protein